MPELLQTLHEQYRTECYGPWHTRECYPWEYDVKAEECIKLANSTDWYHQKREDSSRLFFLTQAKILQDRASHIRHEWAKQEAIKQAAIQSAKQSATQPITVQPAEDKGCPPPSLPPPSTSPAPQKAQKEEDEQLLQQTAVENTTEKQEQQRLYQATVGGPTKQTKPREHIVSERIKLVPWDWSTTSLWCWYAVIPWDGMIMVLLRCGASGMPRIGIG